MSCSPSLAGAPWLALALGLAAPAILACGSTGGGAPKETPAGDAGADSSAPPPEPSADCLLPRSDVPAVLAEVAAAALAVDAEHLYIAAASTGPCPWGSGCSIVAGDLVRMPRCGGPPEIVAAGAGATALFDAPGVLYLRPASGPGLVRLDKRTFATGAVAGTTPSCVGDVAAGPDHLYFHDPCSGDLSRVAHASGAVELFRAGVKATFPDGPGVRLAVSPDAVYWSVDGAVHEVAHAGGAEPALLPGLSQVFAADGRALYGELTGGGRGWGACSRLERVPRGGSEPSPAGLCGTRGVVLAPPYLFQSTMVRSGGSPPTFALTPSVYVTSLETGEVGPLVDSHRAFAANPERVYFSEGAIVLTGAMADLSIPASGGAPPPAATFAWQTTTDDGVASQELRAVMAVPAGGALAVGFEAAPLTQTSGTVGYQSSRPVLIRTGPDGPLLWRSVIDLPDWTSSAVSLCTATDAGGLVVLTNATPTDSSGGGATLLLHRSLADGSALRQGLLPVRDASCASAPSGGAVVAGLFVDDRGGATARDLLVARLDAAGGELWRRTFPRALGFEAPPVVAAAATGEVLVAGKLVAETDFGAGSIGGPGAGFLLRLGASGDVLEARTFGDFVPEAIATAADGRLGLLGSAEGVFDVGQGAEVLPLPSRPHTLLVGFGADGKLAFRTVLEGGGRSQGDGRRLVLAPDGDAFALVRGEPSLDAGAQGVLASEESLLLRLDAGGALLGARGLAASSAIDGDGAGAVLAAWWEAADPAAVRRSGRVARVAW